MSSPSCKCFNRYPVAIQQTRATDLQGHSPSDLGLLPKVVLHQLCVMTSITCLACIPGNLLSSKQNNGLPGMQEMAALAFEDCLNGTPKGKTSL